MISWLRWKWFGLRLWWRLRNSQAKGKNLDMLGLVLNTKRLSKEKDLDFRRRMLLMIKKPRQTL